MTQKLYLCRGRRLGGFSQCRVCDHHGHPHRMHHSTNGAGRDATTALNHRVLFRTHHHTHCLPSGSPEPGCQNALPKAASKLLPSCAAVHISWIRS